ncbi:primosomal protein N' [Anaerotignum propionicum]|uniref:primosomal protein N' n=1 Tax=Anaerotignum propionicum TaxID=28446 RepID=UPI00210B0128|nr:primosomal protein N' [Anaerotignum propionicum]MCQ4936891.1 primosomal protein N' [Anaerotignum propionicum]
MRYARVIVGMNHPQTDRVFDYKVPDAFQEDAKVGVRVIVPFGRRNTKTEGYILSLAEESEIASEKLKDLLEILDDGIPIFTPQMLHLAQWMKEHYFCTLNQCLQAIMPTGIKTKSIWQVLFNETADVSDCKGGELAVLEALKEMGGSGALSELEKLLGSGSNHAIQQLQKKNIIHLKQKMTRSEYKMEQCYYSFNDQSSLLEDTMKKAETDKRLLGQKKLLYLLQEKGEVTLEEIKNIGISESPLKTLLKKGILLERRVQKKRAVFSLEDYEKTTPFYPTAEQRAAIEEIEHQINLEKGKPILLHGVTGSGKTEIYMQSIAKILDMGKQAVVLVPEISLTPQMMERFISRFGQAVSITHSRLSAGERLDQWKKARDGEISVMIGPRSALFMPFSDLGMIIIDEVHDNSYISDITPKYDAREAAKILAEDTGAVLLMGSATPDLVSYHKARKGEYLLLELKERTGGGTLPRMHIVDMCKELEEGNRSSFSRILQQEIAINLEKGQQTMLFLNRRGFATFVSCRSCGHVMRCPECGISYTYHAKEDALMCHYCGKTVESPRNCPICGSKYIRYFGTGTQKIEEEVRRLFPRANVLRMDLDTTMGKNSHNQILEAFRKGQADILVGTQMIAKGHDFPNVTLVGVMAADTSLNTGSFYASENTFQLITQAGGRAGRADDRGRVYIQTYQPKHYCITHAAEQDYKGFYEEEVLLREMMGYPPFGAFCSVVISGEDEIETVKAADVLGEILQVENREKGFFIMGPVPAMLFKFRGEYRQRILIQGPEEDALVGFVGRCVEKGQQNVGKGIHFQLTRNPLNIV